MSIRHEHNNGMALQVLFDDYLILSPFWTCFKRSFGHAIFV